MYTCEHLHLYKEVQGSAGTHKHTNTCESATPGRLLLMLLVLLLLLLLLVVVEVAAVVGVAGRGWGLAQGLCRDPLIFCQKSVFQHDVIGKLHISRKIKTVYEWRCPMVMFCFFQLHRKHLRMIDFAPAC